jgi:MFS family permease
MTIAAEPEIKRSPGTARLDSGATLSALICLFIMGPMFFLLMPLYVGALADDVGLSNQQIGTLTSLELLGACLASLSGLFWIRKANWRMLATASALALLICNLVSTVVSDSFGILILVRTGAGFSSGCLLAISIAAIGDTSKLDRNFALAVAGQLSLSGALFFVLPQLIVVQGVNAIFVVFAACALLALIACKLVPAKGKEQSQTPISSEGAWRPLWGLAGSIAFYIAQTGFWAFVERMGVDAKFSAEFIGVALGTSTLISVGAALGAGWLTLIISRFWLMLIAALGQLVCLAILVDGFSATTYFVAVVLFQICWNAWIPIQMANIAAVDISGRYTVLIGLFQSIGAATGPVLVVQFLTGGSFLPVNIIAAIFVILSLLLFAPIALENKSKQKLQPTASSA